MPAPAALDPAARGWRLAEYVTTFGAGVSFIAGICLWFHFDNTRPHSPDSVQGRVYSLNTHGSVVYLNGREHWLLIALFGTFVALAVIASAIELSKRPFRPTWER